ncbi:MAG: glycosyltransferase family 4 protein [candidate division WOR-3 bacterium]
MRKRILLLNQTFYPDQAATSQYLTDLGVELASKGYNVTAISDRRCYDDRNVVHPRREYYKGVEIIRVDSTAFGKKTKFHRGLDYLSFNISFLLKMLTLPKFDYVIGLTTPPWISFFGMIFCKLKGGIFIHWAMDVNPDEAVRLGWVRQGSLFYELLDVWSRLTYKKSFKIVALDRYMADLIKNKGFSDHKVKVIPIWAHDEIESVPHDKNPFRKEHNLDNKFVIMYSGNFSICHPIDTLLEAAKKLKNEQDIVFLFIGGGVRLPEIINFKEKYHLKNIIYLPYQKREQIKYSLSAADLHIVSMGNDYVGIVHPCKIYGILATGRPFVLLGPMKSHIGDIITQDNIGYQVEHGDVEGLISIIKKVKGLPIADKHNLALESIYLAKNKFSRQTLIAEFLTLFTSP